MRAIESLAPVRDLFSWKLNIVGQHAQSCRDILVPIFEEVEITHDDVTPTYFLQRRQMDIMEHRNPVITWQEDHFFICPHQNLFRYLCSHFLDSDADVLTITHLMTSWQTKPLLARTWAKYLYRIYAVTAYGQEKVWQHYPGAFLTGCPAIYKWGLASDILEFKKEHMSQTRLPEFELDAIQGKLFLQQRSFREMIPTFHVFREVEQEAHSERARERTIPEHVAMSWIRKRDEVEGCGDGP